MFVSEGSMLPVVRWEGGFAANARRRRGGRGSARARARERASRRWGPRRGRIDRRARGSIRSHLPRGVSLVRAGTLRGAHELGGLIGDRVGLSPSRPRGDVGGVCQVRERASAVRLSRGVLSRHLRGGGAGGGFVGKRGGGWVRRRRVGRDAIAAGGARRRSGLARRGARAHRHGDDGFSNGSLARQLRGARDEPRFGASPGRPRRTRATRRG